LIEPSNQTNLHQDVGNFDLRGIVQIIWEFIVASVSSDPYVFGGVICDEPFIVLGKRMPVTGSNLGLMSIRPELFEKRRSLSLLTLAYTHELPYQLKRLIEEIAEAAIRFPLATIVMLANTEIENQSFKKAGIHSLLANELIFGNILNYHLPQTRSQKLFDAVYVGRLHPQKRHELAININSLLCLYYRTDLSTVNKFRESLPNAVFGNHDFNNNEFTLLTGDRYLAALDSSHVGLCLSEAEGAMRASIEYQLCGLPVVTTPSLGGRDRFLQHGFAMTVEPDAQEIAKAVTALKDADFPAQAVRDNAVALIQRDRTRFLEEIQSVITGVFGNDGPMLNRFDFFENACGQSTRPLSKALAPTYRRS
jgi:glycosyltransferase involved in cell wall biosynthesis